ncbi:hypothetical protein [Solibacillus sp. R5-41]|nr:hypothetical protein [Solibacillus sp. R5-41]
MLNISKICNLFYVHNFFVNKVFKERGIDPCGEAGEFHTTVISGPLFKQ